MRDDADGHADGLYLKVAMIERVDRDIARDAERPRPLAQTTFPELPIALQEE